MKLLGMDTTNGVCSVALLKDGAMDVAVEEEMSKQVERLVPMIEAILSKHDLEYEDLDALAVTIGPGSFTGVRIGLAAARAIRLTTKLPLIGVTSTEAIVHQADVEMPALAVLDARRQQVYLQSFDHEKNPDTDISLVAYDEIGDYLKHESCHVIGNGAELIESRLKTASITTTTDDSIQLPTAEGVVKAALSKWEQGDVNDTVAPLYIRPPDAKVSE